MTTPGQPPFEGDSEPPTQALGERYVLDQLQKARVTMHRTRVFSVASMVVFLGYMGFMTANLNQFLQPRSAAELAGGLIAQRVTEQGPQIADQIKQQLPILIGQIPDYVQEQLPTYRQGLEERFQSDLTAKLRSGSDQVDKNMDSYLEAHKDEIKAALTAGKDSAAVQQLGNSTSQDFLSSLKTTQVNGEALQSKLDQSLTSLSGVQKKMDRLANAKDLTPQEKKTRHAIAIMAGTINREAPKLVPVVTASNTP